MDWLEVRTRRPTPFPVSMSTGFLLEPSGKNPCVIFPATSATIFLVFISESGEVSSQVLGVVLSLVRLSARSARNAGISSSFSFTETFAVLLSFTMIEPDTERNELQP